MLSLCVNCRVEISTVLSGDVQSEQVLRFRTLAASHFGKILDNKISPATLDIRFASGLESRGYLITQVRF